jgi:glycosyltransferase involved in cell wall biosynthesis
MLSREGRSVAVALCGAGDSTDWKRIAKDEGISDKVFFFQGLSETDLVRLYRSCDIYANLSNSTRSCGLDLALLEAMAAERPIVVYDTGALASAVSQGRNGYVLPADDIAGVATVIKHFSELSTEEQVRMGKESAEVASKCDIRETAHIKLSWLAEVLTAYHV